MYGQSPAISKGGIIDAASASVGRPVSSGSYVSIYGSNLAAAVASHDTVGLPTTLGNVTVTFSGINAALQFVAPTQINVQVPWNLPNGTANVVVTSNGHASAPEPVVLNQFAPGVYAASGHAFAINVQDPNSTRYGSFAAPVDTFGTGCAIVPQPSTCLYKAFPAQVNDVLVVYAGGLGPLSSAVTTGSLPPDGVFPTAVTTPTVLVNNAPAKVLYAGVSSYVAVYQINMTVPQVAPGNALPFQIQLGGLTSPSSTTIAVQ